MANALRGEVDLPAGDKVYTLRLSINAIAEVETLLDAGFGHISAMLAKPDDFRIAPWRAVLWGALREHHPDIDLFGAGDIIGEATIQATVEALGKAMTLAFPETKGKAGNPQTASPEKAG